MRLGLVAQIVFIVLAAFGVFAFVRAARNDHRLSSCAALCELRPTYAGLNRRVPDFELPDMENRPVRFSSFLGKKPVVLNFWTKTCEPCLEEMPGLAEMAQILAPRGVQVVTITIDEGPDDVRDALQVALQGRDLPFVVLFDPESTVVKDKFGTSLFPETWLIDASGVIRARIDGPRDWTSSLALDVIEMMARPSGCTVEFQAKKPVGVNAALCPDLL